MTEIFHLKEGEVAPEGAKVYKSIYKGKNGVEKVYTKYYFPVKKRKPRRKKRKTLCIDIIKTLDEDTCTELLEYLEKFTEEFSD